MPPYFISYAQTSLWKWGEASIISFISIRFNTNIENDIWNPAENWEFVLEITDVYPIRTFPAGEGADVNDLYGKYITIYPETITMVTRPKLTNGSQFIVYVYNENMDPFNLKKNESIFDIYPGPMGYDVSGNSVTFKYTGEDMQYDMFKQVVKIGEYKFVSGGKDIFTFCIKA